MAKKMLKRDWERRYVRLVRPLETKGGLMLDAGEILVVDRNHGGLWLSTVHRCQHCTRRTRQQIVKVPEHEVMLLPEDFRLEDDLLETYGPKQVEAMIAEVMEGDIGFFFHCLYMAQMDGLSLDQALKRLEKEVAAHFKLEKGDLLRIMARKSLEVIGEQQPAEQAQDR